jgi:LysR family glycine cleavage system transcriptional activator
LPPLNGLKAFEAAARSDPGFDLRVSATMHHVDFAREEVDLAVRHGDGNWAGFEVSRVIASPSQRTFLTFRARTRTWGCKPQKAAPCKGALLHLDDRKTWSKWFEAAGIADADVSHGPVLNRASMLIDAAVNGQGVALARTALAAWDLNNGRLVRPVDISLRLSKSYWIVCPKAASTLPKIATFRDWLLAEAADDTRRLKVLNS